MQSIDPQLRKIQADTLARAKRLIKLTPPGNDDEEDPNVALHKAMLDALARPIPIGFFAGGAPMALRRR
jgi:hypothetical protein